MGFAIIAPSRWKTAIPSMQGYENSWLQRSLSLELGSATTHAELVAVLIIGPPGNSQATFLQLVPLDNGKLAKFFVLFFQLPVYNLRSHPLCYSTIPNGFAEAKFDSRIRRPQHIYVQKDAFLKRMSTRTVCSIEKENMYARECCMYISSI